MKLDARRRARVHGLRRVVEVFPGGDRFAQLFEGEEAGLLGVVEIGGGVGDLVSEID